MADDVIMLLGEASDQGKVDEVIDILEEHHERFGNNRDKAAECFRQLLQERLRVAPSL